MNLNDEEIDGSLEFQRSGIEGIGKTWFIVCQHLIEAPQDLEWNEVVQSGTIQGFLCNGCEGSYNVEDLQPLSYESMRALRSARQ